MEASLELFDRLTMEALEQKLFSGSIIRIERFGKLLFENVWGDALANGPERIPLEAKHLFDLASLSKLFTSTAILRQISLGKLGIETPILDILPFKQPLLRSALAPVRLSSLLDHSCGIHYWYPFYTQLGESFESILATVMAEHPRSDGMVYSDLNFMLLGLVLEQTTGKKLSSAMNELLFSPLGLESATYHPNISNTVATEFGNRIEKQMVATLKLEFGHWREETLPIRGTADDGNCHYYFKGEAGHAGIFANASDVARLGYFYLDNPEARDYLDSAIKKAATTNRGFDRGYGFQFGKNYPQGGFGHTGFTGTYLYINPQEGLTITILTNRLHVANPQDINPYRREVAKTALGIFSSTQCNQIAQLKQSQYEEKGKL
jgi:CubicO group peptidase (beta-lactamase class C family)